MAGSILRENKYVSELEKRIRCLEKENQYLKHLLTDAGISYSEKETDDIVHEYDPDQGAHDSTTGIIDIAMAGSVCRNGEYHRRLKEYGLILVDECHHAASDTIVDILQEANAKYVYGVTATPFRGDGLEKINYMLLGPIRYSYTSKDRAKEQGIEHLVYPRFTRAVAPRFSQDKMHPNEAYEIIRNNEDRDDLIIRDVKQCVEVRYFFRNRSTETNDQRYF